MAAYVIADITITDPEAYREYARQVGATSDTMSHRHVVVCRLGNPRSGWGSGESCYNTMTRHRIRRAIRELPFAGVPAGMKVMAALNEDKPTRHILKQAIPKTIEFGAKVVANHC